MVLNYVIAGSVAGMVLRVCYSQQCGRHGTQGTALKNKAQRLLPSTAMGSWEPAVTVNFHLMLLLVQDALLLLLHQFVPFKA